MSRDIYNTVLLVEFLMIQLTRLELRVVIGSCTGQVSSVVYGQSIVLQLMGRLVPTPFVLPV